MPWARRVRSYRLDVLDAAATRALAKTVEEEFGPVDILVNNAGVAQVMPFAMIEEDDWDRLMGHERQGDVPGDQGLCQGDDPAEIR